MISAPPDAVWASVSDLASHPQWMRDAVAIRFVSAATTGEGVLMDCDTRIGPFRLTDRLRVTQWRDGETIAISHEGAVTGTGTFTLAADGPQRTRFTWTEDLRFPWWLGGPAGAAAARPVLGWLWQGNLRTLRELIEHR